MHSWRKPLDKFTLRYLIERITEDRELHLANAKEAKEYGESAHENFLIRAEECARILQQMKKQYESLRSTPPPPVPPAAGDSFRRPVAPDITEEPLRRATYKRKNSWP
tara:strand:+ start:7719 stop:8042 length:324 start_codon:yes stop_codon:yes gene_type:complete